MTDIQMVDRVRAVELRQAYVDRFIDQEDESYRSEIQTLHQKADGLHYEGFLWDHFRHPELMSVEEFLQEVESHGTVYVMWDLHSNDNVRLKHYRRLPKDSILVVQSERVPDLLPLLPEDLYIFDDSFTWSLALTHEIYHDGSTICYRAP